MSGHGAEDPGLWAEFAEWAYRVVGYLLLTVFGAWVALRRYREWRARHGPLFGAGGPERRGWRGLARAAGNFWE